MYDRLKGCGNAGVLLVGVKGECRGLVDELVVGRLFFNGGTKYMSEVWTVLGRRAGKMT